MDRTKKLLISVTASALLTGGAVASPDISAATTTTNYETPWLDPQVQAVDIVLSILTTVGREQALTVDEIVAKTTAVTRSAAEVSLRQLMSEHKVERTGDRPPRYYNPQAVKINAALPIITEMLRGVAVENALLLDEILAKRPDLEREIAENVVTFLVGRGEARRTGDNSSSKPYRYYDRARRGYGG